jgi:hypothetical protein
MMFKVVMVTIIVVSSTLMVVLSLQGHGFANEGRSVSFNGVNQYVEIPHFPASSLRNGSIYFWFRATQVFFLPFFLPFFSFFFWFIYFVPVFFGFIIFFDVMDVKIYFFRICFSITSCSCTAGVDRRLSARRARATTQVGSSPSF